jgi:hypothetical protein
LNCKLIVALISFEYSSRNFLFSKLQKLMTKSFLSYVTAASFYPPEHILESQSFVTRVHTAQKQQRHLGDKVNFFHRLLRRIRSSHFLFSRQIFVCTSCASPPDPFIQENSFGAFPNYLSFKQLCGKLNSFELMRKAILKLVSSTEQPRTERHQSGKFFIG